MQGFRATGDRPQRIERPEPPNSRARAREPWMRPAFKPIRVERHQLGPRLFVFGKRLHECHAGAVLLAAGLASGLLDRSIPPHLPAVASLVGGWMLLKDWKDLFRARRDTSAWRPGIHRRPRPLRPESRREWLPPLAGWMAGFVGLVNIASTLTPDFRSRADVVRGALPDAVPVAAHALALPAGLALIVVGLYLARRRRRAWVAGVAILTIAGALNLLKGLDVEEALASWLLAAVLVWGRNAFVVRHDSSDRRTVVTQVALLMGALAAAVAAGGVVGVGWGTPPLAAANIFAQAEGLLTFSTGPARYHDPFDWVPAGVALTSAGALLASAYLVFRPLAASSGHAQAPLRHAA